ncbi:hypothetical protein H8E65_12645 [Candidatus Bathyarchaeota archaeon]|nr:hypothetical protein [Candidatus Bathyarchaeota archaeon]MBL7079519.1 hypothetical protein [Candidatus Bathyarchaeota archaeon]
MDDENTLSDEFRSFVEVRDKNISVLTRQLRQAITKVNFDLEPLGLDPASPWEIAAAGFEIQYYDEEGEFIVTPNRE